MPIWLHNSGSASALGKKVDGPYFITYVHGGHWTVVSASVIDVGAQSTLGRHDIFARKICMKN